MPIQPDSDHQKETCDESSDSSCEQWQARRWKAAVQWQRRRNSQDSMADVSRTDVEEERRIQKARKAQNVSTTNNDKSINGRVKNGRNEGKEQGDESQKFDTEPNTRRRIATKKHHWKRTKVTRKRWP